MSADGGRCMASHAAQVCLTCKSRKKKCDKALPGCGYCLRKNLSCRYRRRAPQRTARPDLRDEAGVSVPLLINTSTSADEVSAEVLSLIRNTGYTTANYPNSAGKPAAVDIRLQQDEAANTWWTIVICERSIWAEAANPDQPLVSRIPDGDQTVLPAEQSGRPSSDPNAAWTVGNLRSVHGIGPFGRAAQASWLLDKFVTISQAKDVPDGLEKMQALDLELQGFLSLLLQQHVKEGAILCEPVAIVLGTMFKLHQNILDHQTNAVLVGSVQLEGLIRRSRGALDAATEMVLDIVETHAASLDAGISIAISYPYLVKAGLQHVRGKISSKGNVWLDDADTRLQRALDSLQLTQGPSEDLSANVKI
ncbi:Transcription factor gsfR2 [Colletotrichum orbiculare MAFF 240422]|uniref:Transcription factor gsfR2 n=1 Tax=Colletotrichum orbiculare (strain 104-T / ATCC 96160 / CBS 514.97 / LARS 414 / MAFF 240422) TaxID=1213857 RepID=A0A484FR10_COLOR|nr:Transcription factor gsfR2 [Colletotrichum orbiculare MAFF 240422]